MQTQWLNSGDEMTNYHLTLKSTNSKVGAIPVSTTSSTTCPTSCPLKGNGCYAQSGPLAIHWKAVTDGKRGMTFDEFTQQISSLPVGQIWRYAQAGDLPGEGDAIDRDQLRALAGANAGRPVIAYTHKPPVGANLDALQEAASLGMRINLSADSLDEADDFIDIGLPAVVVLHEDYGRKTSKGEWSESLSEYRARLKTLVRTTPRGRDIAVCPATFVDTNCAACGICANKSQIDVVVGFPAHGTSRKKINVRLGDRSSTTPKEH